MTTMEKQFLTLEKLQTRILSMEEERIAVTNALDIALKINDLPPDTAADSSLESVLAVCYERTEKLVRFKGGGFYLFNEADASFYAAYATTPAIEAQIDKDLPTLIDDGTLAWVIQTERAVTVKLSSGEDVFLHALATPGRTMGVFIGILRDRKEDILDISYALLSIYFSQIAGVLQNRELFRLARKENTTLSSTVNILKETEGKLVSLNRTLEEAVETRTQELEKINARLMAEITERKRKEAALLESEELSASLLNYSPNAILVANPDTSIKYVNFALEQITGYSLVEVINRRAPYPWWEEDENLLSTSEFYELVCRKGTSKREQLFRKKNGELLWVEVNMTSIFGKNGLKYSIANWVDITERKKAEAARERSEQLLTETNIKLSETVSGIVTSMAKVIETRDPYTAGHQERVARLAVAIAKSMNLPAEQTKGVGVAALMHDLGKIDIPAEILSKPSRLKENEYRLIQDHSQAGYEILKNVDFPWPVAQAVLQHHERIDGSGYPQGLTGDEILLEARIIAVADVVEAMSSHRPYRPSLGLKRGLSEVADRKGIAFDADVVNACLDLFSKGESPWD